jgi:hypothetical protein
MVLGRLIKSRHTRPVKTVASDRAAFEKSTSHFMRFAFVSTGAREVN